MIKKIKSYFCPKREEKKDFSSFFNRASAEEKRKLTPCVGDRADRRGKSERGIRANAVLEAQRSPGQAFRTGHRPRPFREKDHPSVGHGLEVICGSD